MKLTYLFSVFVINLLLIANFNECSNSSSDLKIPSSSYVKLNNGREMPPIGFGTFRVKNLDTIVKKTIDVGYRHFDTAGAYNNERELGEGIRQKISDGTVKREEIFIVDKIRCDKLKPELMESVVKKSLSNLGLEYIDLYLIHFPAACTYGEDKQTDGKEVSLEDMWKGMENLVKLGYVKSIGISNFNSIQINRIWKIAEIKPVANQIEVNPYMSQEKMIKFCKDLNIAVIAYSPFATETISKPSVHDQPIIKQLAEKYHKTTGQIILNYLVKLGTVPIPKTSTESRLKENIDIFDFQLASEDILKIKELNANIRGVLWEDEKLHKEYPFSIEF